MATKKQLAEAKAKAEVAGTTEELMDIVRGMKPDDAEKLTGVIVGRLEVLTRDAVRKQMTGEG